MPTESMSINRKNKLVIIDIGSHKLEELLILLKPGKHQFYIFIKWSVRKVVNIFFQMEFKRLLRLGKYFQLVKFYFILSRSYNLKIISIEPNINVAYDYVKKIKAHYPIYYLPVAILGHDSQDDIEMKILPNPLTESTILSLYLKKGAANVSYIITDLLGRELVAEDKGSLKKGGSLKIPLTEYLVNQKDGVYFVVLKANGIIRAQKMVKQ